MAAIGQRRGSRGVGPLKSALVYLVPTVVANIVPLLTLPIFTRLLTRQDYGMLAMAQVYGVFVAGVVHFGLTAGYERNFFQYRDRKAALLYSTLTFVVTMLAIALSLTWIVREPLASLVIGVPGSGTFLFWATISTALAGVKTYYLVFLRNEGNAMAFAWYSVDETVLSAGLSLVFVVALRLGVYGLVWGQFAASALVLALLTVRFLRRLPPTFDWPVLADSLRLSLPLTPRIFVGMIEGQSGKYLTGALSSLGGAGLFLIAQRIAQTVFQTATALQNVFGPEVYARMFGERGEEGRRSLGAYLTPYAYVTAALALAMVLLAEEATQILLSPSFADADVVVMLLAAYYAFLFFGKISGAQLIYARRTGLTSVMTFVGVGFSVALTALLVQRGGALGAAAGILAAGVLFGLVMLAIGQRVQPIAWEYRPLIATFGVVMVSAVALTWMRAAGTPYGWRLAVKAASLGVFAVVGVWIGAGRLPLLAALVERTRRAGIWRPFAW